MKSAEEGEKRQEQLARFLERDHDSAAQEETDFDPKDRSKSENARHERWLALMEQNKGRIDSSAAEKFLGDHFDSFAGKVDYNERTLCGHIDSSPRGWGHGSHPTRRPAQCRTRWQTLPARRRCR